MSRNVESSRPVHAASNCAKISFTLGRLVAESSERENLALAHNRQTGAEAYEQRSGIHALTREQKADAGRKGGQIGGRVVAQKYGHEHFEEIGRKGGQKVAELIERGKRASR